MIRRKKPPKFRNKRVNFDGHTFDSMKEADRYIALRELQRENSIYDLEVHPRFDLIVNEQKIGFYRGDFSYRWRTNVEGSQIVPGRIAAALVVEDVKGYINKKDPAWRVFNMKKKLMLALHGIEVVIV